jgi:hypothetical protein
VYCSTFISNNSAHFVQALTSSNCDVHVRVKTAVCVPTNLNVLDFVFEGKFTFSAEEFTSTNSILN